MSEVRARVLAAVAEGDVTRRHGRHRWWLTEHEHRTLTAAERKHLYALRDEGLVQFEGAAGYSHTSIGYFVLTPDGRRAFAATRPASTEGGA